MKISTPITLEELPNILTAKHIALYLGMSKGTVYELFKIKPEAGGLKIFVVGRLKRVDKQDFIEWLDDRKKERSA